MGSVPCRNECPECQALERFLREERIRLETELVNTRMALATLAFKAGLGALIPGKPEREAPFAVLEQSAKQGSDVGWNALLMRLILEAPERG